MGQLRRLKTIVPEKASEVEMIARSKYFVFLGLLHLLHLLHSHVLQLQTRKIADMFFSLHSLRSEVKRQRTNSTEPPTSPYNPDSPRLLSDQDAQGKRKHGPRGAAAQSHREKELRDKERERAEAASKRKGRAERRRGDGKLHLQIIWL
jgi:hypothetical protein